MIYRPYTYSIKRWLGGLLQICYVGGIVLYALILQASRANDAPPLSIEEFLAQSYATHYKDYDLHIARIIIQPPIATPSLSCAPPNVCSLSQASLLRASGTLIIKRASHEGATSIPIPYTIEADLSILTASTLIHTHDDITKQNARITRLPLSGLKNAKPLPPSLLHQVSARSIIGAGSIITQDKTKERVLVRKGAFITIIIKEASILLQFHAKALQNGAKGEIIRVQNSDTQKILRAKIIDENLAEVL